MEQDDRLKKFSANSKAGKDVSRFKMWLSMNVEQAKTAHEKMTFYGFVNDKHPHLELHGLLRLCEKMRKAQQWRKAIIYRNIPQENDNGNTWIVEIEPNGHQVWNPASGFAAAQEGGFDGE
jgi:hypothetical protein